MGRQRGHTEGQILALRHTTASCAIMSRHHDASVAALLRHSTTALVKRYAHLHPDYLSRVVDDVSQFGQPTGCAPFSSPEISLFGTGRETRPEDAEGEPPTMEGIEILERAMGFEPTTTSLGS